MGLFGYFACSACSLLGRARKPIPKVFKKQNAASAPVRASAAAPTGSTILISVTVELNLKSRDCRSSHSLTKPLNGGSAEMDSKPIRNSSARSFRKGGIFEPKAEKLSKLKPPPAPARIRNERIMNPVPICVITI